MQNRLVKRVLWGLLLLGLVLYTHAQDAQVQKPVYHFNGNVSITNNGFSLIPSFSLGKPATVAIISVGGERFSLDP